MPTKIRMPTSSLRRRRIRDLIGSDYGAVLVAGLVALLFGLFILDPPGRVDVEIDNPTVYEMRLEARSDPEDGWMPVAIIDRETTRTINEVLDLGDGTWTFRFSAQGHVAGTIDWTREELEADDWRIQVPSTIEESLRARGAPPSPP